LLNLSAKTVYCNKLYTELTTSITNQISVSVGKNNIDALNQYIDYLQNKIDNTKELSTKKDVIYFLLAITFYRNPLFISVFIEKYFQPVLISVAGAGAGAMEVDDKLEIPNENIEICRIILQNMYVLNIMKSFITYMLKEINNKYTDDFFLPLNYFINPSDPFYAPIPPVQPINAPKIITTNFLKDFSRYITIYEDNKDSYEYNKKYLKFYFEATPLNLLSSEIIKYINVETDLPNNSKLKYNEHKNRIKSNLEKEAKILPAAKRSKTSAIAALLVKDTITNSKIKNRFIFEQQKQLDQYLKVKLSAPNINSIQIIKKARIKAYQIGSISIDSLRRSITDKKYGDLILIDSYLQNKDGIIPTYINYISPLIFQFTGLLFKNIDKVFCDIFGTSNF
jgi:hypothetical protein